MKYAVGSDPNAVKLKTLLIDELKDMGHEVIDFGSDDTVYANVAIAVGEAVANGEYDRGLLVCGTGIGMSIAANKVKGVVAALISDAYSAERAIKSNNANIICMGELTLGTALARTLLKISSEARFDSSSASAVKVARYKEYDLNRC